MYGHKCKSYPGAIVHSLCWWRLWIITHVNRVNVSVQNGTRSLPSERHIVTISKNQKYQAKDLKTTVAGLVDFVGSITLKPLHVLLLETSFIILPFQTSPRPRCNIRYKRNEFSFPILHYEFLTLLNRKVVEVKQSKRQSPTAAETETSTT